MFKLFVEAVVVGVMVVVVGSGVGFVVGKMNSMDLPKVCKKWNKNHVMEISLFFTGFVTHLLCEFSGVNKWYTKNGYAVKN
jgi:membrane protein DedA with SNARE-associated domain